MPQTQHLHTNLLEELTLMLANAIITDNQRLYQQALSTLEAASLGMITSEFLFLIKIKELKNSTLGELSSYTGTRRDLFSKAL